MRQHRHYVLAWLFAIPCISAGPIRATHWLSLGGERQEDTDTIDVWVRDNHDAVLNLVLEGPCTGLTESRDSRWVASVRIVSAYTRDLEYTLTVAKGFSGAVQARIIRPKARSIYSQLYSLKKEHPASSALELAKLIRTETRDSNQEKLPALARYADEFEKIRVSPALSSDLMMDATKYAFCSKSSAGNRMELVLLGPGPSAPHQPEPLLQWAESLRETLASSFK